MKTKYSTPKEERAYCCGLILSLVFIVSLVSLWSDRNLDFWASYFKGVNVDVPFWVSLVASALLSKFMIVLNVIAEIGRFFI